MLTITSKLQMDQCRKEKNLLLLEQSIQMNETSKITRRLDSYESAVVKEAKEATEAWNKANPNNKKNFDKDSFLQELQMTDEVYIELSAYNATCETRNAAIETELKVLDQAMKTFESEHQAGVEKDTAFWCFGGS